MAIRAAVLAAAALVVALPLQEIAVRFALPEFDPSRQVRFHGSDGISPNLATPGASLRQIKNTGDYNVVVRINRHGLRDEKDVSEARAEDWLAVGDSFGFGWGVDVRDRFSEQLEPRLNRRVFNVSIPGGLGSADRLLAYAGRLGGDIRRVIVQITMERDLTRYDTPADSNASTPVAVSHVVPKVQMVKEWLLENSELYFLVTTQIHQANWLESLAAELGLVRRNLDAVHKADFDPVAIASTADRVASVIAPYSQSAVLIVPARSLWIGTAGERAIADQAHRAFIAALSARNIRVIDMRPSFEADGKPMAFHFANDGHWNARGHALAAETLARALEPPSLAAPR